jgi:hypothetical protein
MQRFWDSGWSKLWLAVLTACLITHTAPAQSSFGSLSSPDYQINEQNELVVPSDTDITDSSASGFNPQTDSGLIINKAGVGALITPIIPVYTTTPPSTVPTVDIITRVDPQTGPPMDIVSPVPEPSSIAFMLAGAGLLLARLHRLK